MVHILKYVVGDVNLLCTNGQADMPTISCRELLRQIYQALTGRIGSIVAFDAKAASGECVGVAILFHYFCLLGNSGLPRYKNAPAGILL